MLPFLIFSQLSGELNRLTCERNQLNKDVHELQTSLKEASQQLHQKQGLEDKFENELRFLRSNIAELENIEYPPENEAEILVNGM